MNNDRQICGCKIVLFFSSCKDLSNFLLLCIESISPDYRANLPAAAGPPCLEDNKTLTEMSPSLPLRIVFMKTAWHVSKVKTIVLTAICKIKLVTIESWMLWKFDCYVFEHGHETRNNILNNKFKSQTKPAYSDVKWTILCQQNSNCLRLIWKMNISSHARCKASPTI